MSLTEISKSAVDSLKGSPGFLALVLINALVFILTYLALQAEQDRRQAVIIRLLDACQYHEKN